MEGGLEQVQRTRYLPARAGRDAPLFPLRRIVLSPKTLIGHLHLTRTSRVLEVGPGPGLFSIDVARAIPEGRLELVDIQIEMLRKARGRLRRAGGCSVTDAEHFRNRAYSFRGWMHREARLVLRNGKALERNDVGAREWETELLRHSVVSLGGQSAVMLRFFADHVGGTGSFGTVLIATTRISS